jgi:hypothetical protein
MVAILEKRKRKKMFKIIDTQNNHLPVKSGFPTAAKAYNWAKKNLPTDSCSEWGKMKFRRDRYYIIQY